MGRQADVWLGAFYLRPPLKPGGFIPPSHLAPRWQQTVREGILIMNQRQAFTVVTLLSSLGLHLFTFREDASRLLPLDVLWQALPLLSGLLLHCTRGCEPFHSRHRPTDGTKMDSLETMTQDRMGTFFLRCRIKLEELDAREESRETNDVP